MKILIIGPHRSRSTYLQEIISSNYNIINIGENWKFVSGNFHYYSTLNKTINNTHFDIFQQKFKFNVEKDFKNDFVSKLFPRMLIFAPNLITDLSSYNYKIITNLTYYLNIKKFDKIYFLERNLVDGCCSWIYGHKIDQFIFRNINTLQEKINLNSSIFIDYQNNPILKFYIFECALVEHLNHFLIREKIKFIKLNYDDIPVYVANNFSKVKSNTLETKFDYSTLITNYNDVEKFVSKFYLECLEHVKQIKFT